MKHIISLPRFFKKNISDSKLWGFCLDVFTVIIGIAITFYVQRIIDDKKTEQDLQSALQLVIDELNTNKEDLASCAVTMDNESTAANYFLLNKDNLAKCPRDSVFNYGMRITHPTILTLSQDALDLMKNSLLFQAIEDKNVSLSILRAYDICNVLLDVFNYHESTKNDLVKKVSKIQGFKEGESAAALYDFPKMMRDQDAVETIVTLRMNGGRLILQGLPMIDEAISQIETYLNNRK